MKIEIKSWLNGSILFEGDFSCLAEAVKAAVKARADLSRANLSRANLSRADLSRADLSGADLSGANLSGANLSWANLSGADLSRADLSRADLSRADLSRADLSRADLSGADLSRAKEAELTIARTRILPEGDLIGWKKLQDGLIAKLLIPSGAKRSHAFGRKCRAEFAKVLEIWDGKKAVKEGGAMHDQGATKYRTGKVIKPDSFSTEWQTECAPGIHFYITRLEAEAHT
jgi:hypothetical protein